MFTLPICHWSGGVGAGVDNLLIANGTDNFLLANGLDVLVLA